MKKTIVAGLMLAGIWASPAQAFNLRPESSLDEEIITLKEDDFGEWFVSDLARSIVRRFTEPVHEIITNKAWGCRNATTTVNAAEDDCRPQPAGNAAPAALLAGVRWNDNPSFRLLKTSLTSCQDKYVWLPVESVCWARVFKKGEKDARGGAVVDLKSENVLLLRSHFGDLQFLHAMRSGAKETPRQTQQKVLMWAEFMWRGALGQFRRGTSIAETAIDGLARFFYPGDTVQRIFFRGNPAHVDEFPLFALGSLIHMVEDSFSASHVVREAEGSTGRNCPDSDYYQPARIVSFQNYAEQKSHDHAERDTYVAMRTGILHDPVNVVSVVRTLRELYDKKADWETEAGPYLRCVFDLAG